MNKYLRYTFAIFIYIPLLYGCKKFIQTDAPFTNTSSDNIYKSDATATSVLNGMYTTLAAGDLTMTSGGLPSSSLFTSLSSDELTLFNLNNINLLTYYTNSLNSNQSLADYWTSCYQIIYRTNAAIEGLTNSNILTSSVRKQLIGESKFVRAFCYFYLVNFYGELPLATTTNYKINSALNRSPKSDVYQQIINDLKDAKAMLSDKYLKGDAMTAYTSGSEERVRPTKWAATALLARTYLYTGDWANAEKEADTVISNVAMFSLETLANAFKKNNKEAIWQLQSVGTGTSSNTGEGKFFILPSTGPSISFPVYLNNNLVNSFELGDQRRYNRNWIDSVKVGTAIYYFPYKYKIGAISTASQEYTTVLRLAELFLIRSEARAQQDNLQGAIFDVDRIRQRANLSLIANINPGISKTALLNAILHERQVELFTEWGHRWFDLKRTGKIDMVMNSITPQKSNGATNWQSFQQLYPISQSEIAKMPKITQNPGYN